MTTILVLDDDSDIRAVLRLRFESLGWQVREAQNGHEALALANEQPPDVLLLDYLTPGLTGLEVLAALRLRPATARIPAIIMTGTERHRVEAQARALGIFASLAKPVDLQQLVRTIQQCLPGK
jgi:two-component system phosphate regulon response regulator PhoB